MQHLNQQQVADYLRQTQNKKLVKRVEKHAGSTETFSPIPLLEELKLQEESFFMIPGEGEESSFYSMSSNSDIYKEILAMQNEWDDLSTVEFVRLFGLLGVSYCSKVQDWIDPYRFEVMEIFGKPFLSQQDLREANATRVNGQEAQLCAPGHSNPIQGVIPLRRLHPGLFDLMMKKARSLLEIQSSINMRRMISPIRSDLLGERIGVLTCIMRSVEVNAPIPEWKRDIFDDIRLQVEMLLNEKTNAEEFEPIFQWLRLKTIRNHLSGANNISCANKILLAMLHSRALKECFAVADLPLFMCELYEFDAYHAARQHLHADGEARKQLLLQMFQVNVEDIWKEVPNTELDHVESWIEEHKEEEKKERGQGGVFVEDIIRQHAVTAAQKMPLKWDNAICFVKSLSWIPNRDYFASYLRFIGGDTPQSRELAQAKTEWMTDVDLLTAVVFAIHCPNETDRIKNGSCTYDFQARNVEEIVREFYITHYMTQAKYELKKRSDKVLQGIVVRLAMMHDLDSFLISLNDSPIRNREQEGYGMLINELQNSKWTKRPALKCAILISGRNREGNPVWNQGNFDVNFMTFRSWFVDMWKRPDLWTELLDLRGRFNRHFYRLSCKHNRHGNCNNPENCDYCTVSGCLGTCYWCMMRKQRHKVINLGKPS
jgi:hypothetical protein